MQQVIAIIDQLHNKQEHASALPVVPPPGMESAEIIPG